MMNSDPRITLNVRFWGQPLAEEFEEINRSDLCDIGQHDHRGDRQPQPPIHPIHGPNALVPQVNVVPQSGVSADSSL